MSTNIDGHRTPKHKIEVRVREINQLFNSIDPSPFTEKDLDKNVEDFLVSWAQEYPLKDPLIIRIHVDQISENENNSNLSEAFHHYFLYRARLMQMELGRLFAQGRTSLAIGLAFLAACMLLVKWVVGASDDNAWIRIARESLTIAGWVAMWRPMQIYLYDWWPLMRRQKIYLKLGRSHVDLLKSKGL